MNVKSADFVNSSVRRDQWPKDNLPCIAFAGRSNVGKSSLINRILGRKSLVRVSRTPGRTQMLNFFLVNKSFYFVDLPGYGYAKVPMSVRKQWGPMIRTFLEEYKQLRAVVMLMDARHGPSPDDESLLDWLEETHLPTIPVLTKSDKISNNALARSIVQAAGVTGLPNDAFTLFSAVEGRGVTEVWGRITAALAEERAKVQPSEE